MLIVRRRELLLHKNGYTTNEITLKFVPEKRIAQFFSEKKNNSPVVDFNEYKN